MLRRQLEVVAPGVDWDALRLGIVPGAPVIRDLIRHEQSGLLVDPKRGIVYGAAGKPIGAVCSDGYVKAGRRPEWLPVRP